MIVLVTGGASSGKSAYAEGLALSLPGPHWYVATMARSGAEAERRIERHRQLRKGKGFRTVETCGDGGSLVSALTAVRGGTALVEDLGNLVSTRLFLPDGTMAAVEDVLASCEADLAGLVGHVQSVVFVGNQIGSDGVSYDQTTMAYLRLLGTLSCRLAAHSDAVVEVVCGRPNVLKGAQILERA